MDQKLSAVDSQHAQLDSSIPVELARVMRTLPAGHLAYLGADGEMTYDALDQQSNRLANALIARLGRAGTDGSQLAVAGLLPHAGSSLIGLLGIFKTGHFCLPLDPAHGTARHSQIIADCPPAAWVTTRSLLDHAQALRSPTDPTPLLVIDDLPSDTPDAPVEVAVSPQATALVYYTSGSTGKPLGVLFSHRQAVAFANTFADLFSLTHASRTLHVNSIAFISSATLYSTLLNGAAVCAFSLQDNNFAGLYQFLSDQQVTNVGVTVSTLRALIDLANDRPPLTAVRTIAFGAEAITARDLKQTEKLLSPDCRLVCVYGSTETSTCTFFFTDVGITWTEERVPAGYADKNMDIMIIGETDQPVPPGVEGQIAVRSRYISPGYLNHPELNATRFLPDPDGGDRRIFLTGDRGKMTADGLLYHLGRIDFMVKIRGYRIEPERIEIALLAHPAIKECGVIAWQPPDKPNPQLIAYFLARDSSTPSTNQLREFLSKTLPPYMLPARFIQLEQMPHTVNHKINRHALPPPGNARPHLDTPLVAPRSEWEQQVANIWVDLLNVDEIGVEDNFFDLGGDSLTALRMLLEVEKQFNVKVGTAFFQNPTVSRLTALLESKTTPSAPAEFALNRPQRKVYPAQPLIPPRSRFVREGPILRGRTPLPYGLGARLQRAWLSISAVQRWFFDKEVALLQRWGERIGTLPDAAVIQQSLMVNTWRGWRSRTLTAPLGSSPWVSVQGDPTLWQAQPQGRIYLVMHTPLTRLFYHSLVAGGVKTVFISGATGETDLRTQDRSIQLYRAYQSLSQGEALIIAGDGGKGRQGVEVPFFGGQRLFQQGGAELAVQTGAALIPVFCTLATNGRVNIEVCPPLERGGGSARTQIERLTRAYADLVVLRWPQIYASLEWDNLARWLANTQQHAEAS